MHNMYSVAKTYVTTFTENYGESLTEERTGPQIKKTKMVEGDGLATLHVL